jgi:lysophospholipase L1-like esterase
MKFMFQSSKYALLLCGLFLIACNTAATGTANPTPEFTQTAASLSSEGTQMYTYLALGDSYTIGESVLEKDRWPVQLANRLNEAGITIDAPVIIARTGWTTDELSDAIQKAALEGQFDLVTLLIGVNNQYRGRSSENYRQEFISLLETAIKFAGGDAGHVIVVSIPDYGVTPFAARSNPTEISSQIDLFNAINLEETTRLGAQYVNITPISRTAKDDPTLLAPDGLHPSGKMYTAWVEEIVPLAIQLFEK